MSVKESVWKVLDLWCQGLDRWRGPLDVVWILYVAAYICIGRAGVVAAFGPAGAAAFVAVTLFVVFVLPFLPRKAATK